MGSGCGKAQDSKNNPIKYKPIDRKKETEENTLKNKELMKKDVNGKYKTAEVLIKKERKVEANYRGLPNRFFPKFELLGEPFGISGLANLGNTSFINTALQILFATQPLADYFLNGLHMRESTKFRDAEEKSAIVFSFHHLLKHYWSSRVAVLEPYEFYNAIKEELDPFGSGEQHDLHEFFESLFDKLNDELNRATFVEGGDDVGMDPQENDEEPEPIDEEEEEEEEEEDDDDDEDEEEEEEVTQQDQSQTVKSKSARNGMVPVQSGMNSNKTQSQNQQDDDYGEEDEEDYDEGEEDEEEEEEEQDLSQQKGNKKGGGKDGPPQKNKDVKDVYGRFKDPLDSPTPVQKSIEKSLDMFKKGIEKVMKMEAKSSPVAKEKTVNDVFGPKKVAQSDRIAEGGAKQQSYLTLSDKYGNEDEDDEGQSMKSKGSKHLYAKGVLPSDKSSVRSIEQKGGLKQVGTSSETGSKKSANGKKKKQRAGGSKQSQRIKTMSDIVGEKEGEDKKSARSSAGFKGGFAAKGRTVQIDGRQYGPQGRRAKDFDYDVIESELTVIDMAKGEWEFTLYENSSIMVDLFQGQVKTTLKCLSCGNISHKFEPYSYISLPVPNVPEVYLEDCIQDFLKTERLGESDFWNCSNCRRKTRAIKKMDLSVFPSILMIHLSRFEINEDAQSKLDTLVRFPIETLDMRPFMKIPQKDTPLYRLYAIAEHEGTVQEGHYTAVVRNQMNGKWYFFDDEVVSVITNDKTVEDEPLEEALVTPRAYILFYAKVSIPQYLRQSVSGPERWPFSNRIKEVKVQPSAAFRNPERAMKEDLDLLAWLNDDYPGKEKEVTKKPNQGINAISQLNYNPKPIEIPQAQQSIHQDQDYNRIELNIAGGDHISQSSRPRSTVGGGNLKASPQPLITLEGKKDKDGKQRYYTQKLPQDDNVIDTLLRYDINPIQLKNSQNPLPKPVIRPNKVFDREIEPDVAKGFFNKVLDRQKNHEKAEEQELDTFKLQLQGGIRTYGAQKERADMEPLPKGRKLRVINHDANEKFEDTNLILKNQNAEQMKYSMNYQQIQPKVQDIAKKLGPQLKEALDKKAQENDTLEEADGTSKMFKKLRKLY